MSEEAIAFIAELFGDPITQAPIYFSSLANERDGSGEVRLATRDQEQVTAFIRKHDRPGRGLFVCAGTVNGKRNKDTIAESVGLYTDIDFKDHPGVPAADIRAKVDHAKLKPSIIVNTGHGLHVWYLFHAGLDAQVHRERLETALRALADHFGGDTQVAEISRLMRLPGTHNTKFDSWVPVTAEITHGNRYSLEDLEGWLLTNTRPLLQRRVADGPPDPSGGAPSSPTPSNPFLAAAAAQGFKPPIDVEALLAGMALGNIHATQLSVSAALLERGSLDHEVVKTLLAATRKAAAGAGVKWNWKKEERDIFKMCLTWLEKHPKDGQPDRKEAGQYDREKSDEIKNVVDLGEARTRAQAKPKPAPKQDKAKKHIVLAKTVLEVLRERGKLLLFTSNGNYRYTDNLWRLVLDKELTAWLDAQLEAGAVGLELQSDKRLINEARAWIMRQPELHRTDVAFDNHGMVPTRSGLVDPRTNKLTSPAPEHYATWRIECDYVPAARCPNWLRMMNDALGDRNDVVRSELIALLQEILGAGLIDARGKALSKALVFWGTNDTAKSGLLDVMARMFGKDSNKTPFKSLDGTHGLMPFEKRRPWLLHEAFDQGAWFFSSVVKSIISGDEISINVKNGPFLSRRVRAPILWGTNHKPQFKEATRAMAERMIIIRCRKQFKQDAPVGVAAIAQRQGYAGPADLVIDTEMEGLLAWAIAGLQRCLIRGFFITPDEVKAEADNVVRDSNLVAGFIEECVAFDRNSMISTPDFAGAFSVWWLENKGDDARIPSSDAIGTALSAFGDARIAVNSKELRTNSRRYYAGIGLNMDGMRYWRDMHKTEAFNLKGRKIGMSSDDEKPNKPIPSSWADRLSILAMQKAFDEGDTSDTYPPKTGDSSIQVSPKVSPMQPFEKSKKPRF
jgi:phage/plasmid-associated DNA primase